MERLGKDSGDNSDDFVAWLKENGELLKIKYPELAQIIDDNNSGKDPNAPRMLFGVYCGQRLNDYVELAKNLGITVKVETGVNVIDAIQDYEDTWYLKTKEKNTLSTKNLIIATGHMPADKFMTLHSHPGYYDTPYQDLSSIPDAPVIILGSALSAIDAVKLVAAKKIQSPIYMISPSGQLPHVKGPSATYQLKFLTRENLDKPKIRLNEILDLFTEEVKNATGNDSWTIESILAEAKSYHLDPKGSLHEEIDIVGNKKSRTWQAMLGQIWADPIALIWEHLDDRDRKEFVTIYFPLYQKWAAGMTFGSAKEMAALFDKGQLRVMRTRNEVCFSPESKQFELKIDDQKTISAATVINATGTGENIKKNISLDAMTKRGLIEQAQYMGGLHLTPALQVISAGKKTHHNAWGIGYITLGSNIGASSMEQAAHDAKIVALQVAKNMLTAKREVDLEYKRCVSS